MIKQAKSVPVTPDIKSKFIQLEAGILQSKQQSISSINKENKKPEVIGNAKVTPYELYSESKISQK